MVHELLPWGLEPGHTVSQLSPLRLYDKEMDLPAKLGVHQKANSHWSWMPTTLRLVKVEETVVFSGPVSGSLLPSPYHIRFILGKQTGAVPTRTAPCHLIPGCLTRNFRRQKRAWHTYLPGGEIPWSRKELGKPWGQRPQPQGVTDIGCVQGGRTLKRWHWFSMGSKETHIVLWLSLGCLNHLGSQMAVGWPERSRPCDKALSFPSCTWELLTYIKKQPRLQAPLYG